MKQEGPRYISYLLRMWQVKGERGWAWRASLESPGSGKLRAFPSLERLITFLKEATSKPEPGDGNLDE